MIGSPAFQAYLRHPDFLTPLGLPADMDLHFSLLGQGEYNANYRFTHPITHQELVLRINTGSQMHLKNQIEYEFLALKALQSCGRTPSVLFFDDSRKHIPYGILVMQWLPGRPLRYESDLSTAAAILADIHSLPVPENHSLIVPDCPARAIFEECKEMAAHYFSWSEADPRALQLLRALFLEIEKLPLDSISSAAKCIVNTELNSGNFLINDHGPSYLVDWEKPLLSEPAQDLAHFLVPTTTFWKTDTILSPEQISAFLDLYRNAVGNRIDLNDLNQRFSLFFQVTCLRGVTWCAMALREYSEPGRALTNADTYAKIKAYMEPAFLENILENYVQRDFLQK